MKLTNILLFVLFGYSLVAQIKFAKVEPEKQFTLINYDSTINFIPKEHCQILKGRALFSINQENPYYQFRKENNFGKEEFDLKKGTMDLQVYFPKSIDFTQTNYDSIVGLYFKVIDVIVEFDSLFEQKKYFLKLLDVKREETIYFEYPEFDSSFPFIALEFYEKERKSFLNKKFIFNDNFFLENSKTGKKDKINNTKTYVITDFVIDQNSFNPYYILEDSIGNRYNVKLSTMDIIKGSIKFIRK